DLAAGGTGDDFRQHAAGAADTFHQHVGDLPAMLPWPEVEEIAPRHLKAEMIDQRGACETADNLVRRDDLIHGDAGQKRRDPDRIETAPARNKRRWREAAPVFRKTFGLR